MTIVTIGSATPAKIGLSTIKLARRAGKLSTGLVDDVAALAHQSINDDALVDLGRAAKRFDPGAMLSAAKSIVKPGSVQAFENLGNDVYAIGHNSGYRGVLDVLGRADNITDVSQAARLSRPSRFNRCLTFATTAAPFVTNFVTSKWAQSLACQGL